MIETKISVIEPECKEETEEVHEYIPADHEIVTLDCLPVLAEEMGLVAAWTEEGTQPFELALVKVPYYDFNDIPQTGELVVHVAIAEKVLALFRHLFEIKFPIEKVDLAHRYDNDDDLIMRKNISTGYNPRCVADPDLSRKKRVSQHAKGRSIDINPLINPWVKVLLDGTVSTQPKEGREFCDRNVAEKGKITAEVVRIFVSLGFLWGGFWEDCQDFQHIEDREGNDARDPKGYDENGKSLSSPAPNKKDLLEKAWRNLRAGRYVGVLFPKELSAQESSKETLSFADRRIFN